MELLLKDKVYIPLSHCDHPSKDEYDKLKSSTSKKSATEFNPIVVHIDYKNIIKEKRKIYNNEPLECSQCYAVFDELNSSMEDGKWVCYFCKTPQLISKTLSEMPKASSVYNLNVPKKDLEEVKDEIFEDDTECVIIIDNSGSMSLIPNLDIHKTAFKLLTDALEKKLKI